MYRTRMDDELELMLDELEMSDFTEDGDDAELMDGEDIDLTAALRGSLHDDYADALDEELDDALDSMFESLSPAEAFNLGKALQQIERGASRILADPTVGQIARRALPLAGGAVGTLVGGPAGTALGSSLGSAAAKALPAGTKPSAATPVAAGSPAATQALMLTQQQPVLQSLLAAALGERGRKEINGVPVGAVLAMLSSVFGQAAAEADEMLDASEDVPRPWSGSSRHPMGDPHDPADRARNLYACLLDDESDLLEEVDW